MRTRIDKVLVKQPVKAMSYDPLYIDETPSYERWLVPGEVLTVEEIEYPDYSVGLYGASVTLCDPLNTARVLEIEQHPSNLFDWIEYATIPEDRDIFFAGVLTPIGN